MIRLPGNISKGTRILLWLARITATVVIIPLMMITFGEAGSGPSGWREYAYLALFPFGFSIVYVLGWWKPLISGYLSLFCMVSSLVVIGRVFDTGAYVIWGVLCIPGVLYILGGTILRKATNPNSEGTSGEPHVP